MDVWAWILVLAVAVLVGVGLAIAALVVRQRRRRRELHEWFGPEYDRSVESTRSRRKAERELASRAARRDRLEIRPLNEAARARYATQWAELQGRFVDRPLVAVVDADELCTQVMRDRGYPIEDFESQAELISVDHPVVVQNYRAGHAIYSKTLGGDASTEDLRQAVVAYRALFDDLLGNGHRPDEHARS
jgi:hypothetical protein